MVPQILNFARWLWQRLAPEKARYFVHLGLQRGCSWANDLKLEFMDALESFWHILDHRFARWPGQAPLRVVGLFSASHGISRGAWLTCRALEHLGLPYVKIDASSLILGSKDSSFLDGRALGWVIQMNPPELYEVVRHTDPLAMKGPRYGYWAWELPIAPESWRGADEFVTEIWATSAFTARSFRAFNKPVRPMPHPIVLADYERVKEAPKRAPFAAITLFDFQSSVDRKNPMGAISVFKTAFGEDPTVCLTIKTQNGHLFPKLLSELRLAATSNITLIDEVWTYDRVLTEIKASDVLISLHRAEGFGLTMAEAMALGTPVLATGWSGNLDFMDDSSAILTPFSLVPVADSQGFYQGQHWADADLDFAVSRLKRLRTDPVFARQLSKAAAEAVGGNLSPEVWFSKFPLGLRLRILASALRRG